MWIGYGAYALVDWLLEKNLKKLSAPIGLGLALLAGPMLLATQNWDDHDRSGR